MLEQDGRADGMLTLGHNLAEVAESRLNVCDLEYCVLQVVDEIGVFLQVREEIHHQPRTPRIHRPVFHIGQEAILLPHQSLKSSPLPPSKPSYVHVIPRLEHTPQIYGSPLPLPVLLPLYENMCDMPYIPLHLDIDQVCLDTSPLIQMLLVSVSHAGFDLTQVLPLVQEEHLLFVVEHVQFVLPLLCLVAKVFLQAWVVEDVAWDVCSFQFSDPRCVSCHLFFFLSSETLSRQHLDVVGVILWEAIIWS